MLQPLLRIICSHDLCTDTGTSLLLQGIWSKLCLSVSSSGFMSASNQHWVFAETLATTLQSVEPGFTVTAIRVLAFVARHPGCRKQVLEDNLDLQNTTSSRTLQYLDRQGLIKREVDPDYYRRTLCFLTDKGKALSEKLASAY